MSAARLIVSRVLRAAILPRARVTVTPRVVATQNTVALWRRYSTQKAEQSDEQFDTQWEAYFNREDIDAWELRNGVNDLYGHDLVPEPKIVIAMLKAARRLDDVAMAIRILESVKQKAGGNAEVYSYIIDEIRPTLKELGIATPEELNLA